MRYLATRLFTVAVQSQLVSYCYQEALINQTEKPRMWGWEGESEMGGATVILPYVGHQMLNFTLIYYVIIPGKDRLG